MSRPTLGGAPLATFHPFMHRLLFANLPTPLDEAARLRQALGGPDRCPRILIKRDDLTGLATGGNKARKLEFSVGQAQARGATVLVTTGATQSNHARSTAAAARRAGMRAVLVLTADPPAPAPIPAGNHLLDLMLGADIHFVAPGPPPTVAVPYPENPHEVRCVSRLMAELLATGEVPYLVPLGASDAIGTAGYVEAAVELEDQLRAVDVRASRVYVGAGTRGTQAGLVLGGKMIDASWRVHGVAVSPGDPEKTARAVEFTNACAERLGSAVRVGGAEFVTHQEYYGEGYAIPTPGGIEAIRLLAETEAMILDPVYTAKAMAGMLDHIRRGTIGPQETIVFIHTGGIASVFAQADQVGLGST
jgi:L-cysteate sulfo-lyase